MTALFTLCGAAIGSVSSIIISIYAMKRNEVSEKQRQTINKIVDILSNFHNLEEIYIEKLIDARTKNGEKTFVTHDAILKETRKKLREKGIDFDFSPSDIGDYKKTLNN